MSQTVLPESARWLPAGTFANSTCLVTGGGTGLGLEISRGHRAHACGCHRRVPLAHGGRGV